MYDIIATWLWPLIDTVGKLIGLSYSKRVNVFNTIWGFYNSDWGWIIEMPLALACSLFAFYYVFSQQVSNVLKSVQDFLFGVVYYYWGWIIGNINNFVYFISHIWDYFVYYVTIYWRTFLLWIEDAARIFQWLWNWAGEQITFFFSNPYSFIRQVLPAPFRPLLDLSWQAALALVDFAYNLYAVLRLFALNPLSFILNIFPDSIVDLFALAVQHFERFVTIIEILYTDIVEFFTHPLEFIALKIIAPMLDEFLNYVEASE